jgi:hypothetical protein
MGVLQELRDRGLRPSEWVFSSLIYGLCVVRAMLLPAFRLRGVFLIMAVVAVGWRYGARAAVL